MKLRSKEYLAYVRSLPCTVTRKSHSVAHHITFVEGNGMGTKVSDHYTVPLSPEEHALLHQMGEKRYWSEHEFDLEEVKQIALDIWREYEHKRN